MGIKLLVAEEFPNVSWAIIRLLDKESDIEVIGEAKGGAETLRLAQKARPDVLLVDLHLSDMNGIAVTRAVKRSLPAVQVILLSGPEEEDEILDAVRAGARGYVPRDTGAEALICQVRRVYAGGIGLSEEMVVRLVDGLMLHAEEDQEENDRVVITEREKEILSLVAQGTPNKNIAFALALSENTVRAHVRNLMHKLDADNRTQLAVYALKNSRKLEVRRACPETASLLEQQPGRFGRQNAARRTARIITGGFSHTAA